MDEECCHMSDGQEAAGVGPNEPTTMRFPGLGGQESTEALQGEHVLTRADQATVDALRPGTALLVVLRGPTPAPASCSMMTRCPAVGTRTATSSSTT